ncbi:hypothetical protein RHP75_15910 [Pseudomonas sp. SG20056]|uniref:hypothetical protein n=1 Tax=Pseudomonas sp. SG20056 TaxID=3074146 RepID=UPI00287FCD4E|nr:hypothetical protein [Pseudomonas sp. SG20056]WNF45851.1 hypothetical protein RHP75_15910 [Pseudomonas sp. SG20056]
MSEEARTSIQLKVTKQLQSCERIRDDERLMLQEAIRKHAAVGVSPSFDLDPNSEQFRSVLSAQLQLMPYLREALVPDGNGIRRMVLTKQGTWTALNGSVTEREAEIALRARIANGFGFDARDHWGKTKVKIRDVLLPKANKLLQLASVQRLLAEALAKGARALVCNGVVFWYEPDGGLGWQVKQASTTKDSEGATIWVEGTIYSSNHGRLVILPYIKENGEKVKGHTKNGPNDGPAKPRHHDHYVEIPFQKLEGDLMITLYGELPYE